MTSELVRCGGGYARTVDGSAESTEHIKRHADDSRARDALFVRYLSRAREAPPLRYASAALAASSAVAERASPVCSPMSTWQPPRRPLKRSTVLEAFKFSYGAR